MKEHCYEPIVKVEYGWRIDYNPCRHYNTLYITIDTKELLFNGVSYNRFNIQDINYQNGTIYINVGNRLLSCKLPTATTSCPGLMSPLDKQQLDYIFQLLQDGVDSINISENTSWGVGLFKNIDKQIQPIVSPVTTLEELKNLPENTEKLVSAQLLKRLIELNGLIYEVDDTPLTYTVSIIIGRNTYSGPVEEGNSISFEHIAIPEGYELRNLPEGFTYSNGILTVSNVTGTIERELILSPIDYTIEVLGEQTPWERDSNNRTSYNIESDTFDLKFTLNSGYENASVTYKVGNENPIPVTSNNNVYIISIRRGQIGNIVVTLSASESVILNSIEVSGSYGLSDIKIYSGGTNKKSTTWNTGTVTATYSNGTHATVTSSATVTLSSSNDSIAKVNGTTITAVAQGEATITAHYSYTEGNIIKTVDKQATITVTPKAVTSIRWAETSTVTRTVGEPLNLGYITVTYNNNDTESIAYNASGVTLWTNPEGTNSFNNLEVGTHSLYAKYGNKITTNSREVTLRQVVTYYWYVGTTVPTNPTNNDENTGLNKWTSLGSSLPTSSIKVTKVDDTYNYHTWYIAAPNAANFVLYNATNVASNEAGWNKTLSAFTVDSIPYTLWTSKATSYQAVGYLHK